MMNINLHSTEHKAAINQQMSPKKGTKNIRRRRKGDKLNENKKKQKNRFYFQNFPLCP